MPATVDQHEKNKAMMRSVTEAFNSGKHDIVDKVIHPDIKDPGRFERFAPELHNKPTAKRVQTKIELLRQAFPDLKFTEEALIAEGDIAMLRWSMTGTHRGPFLGRKPTNKKVKIFGTEFVRIKDDKMIEHHSSGTHLLDLARQLGFLDSEFLQQLPVDDL